MKALFTFADGHAEWIDLRFAATEAWIAEPRKAGEPREPEFRRVAFRRIGRVEGVYRYEEAP